MSVIQFTKNKKKNYKNRSSNKGGFFSPLASDRLDIHSFCLHTAGMYHDRTEISYFSNGPCRLDTLSGTLKISQNYSLILNSII